MGAALPVIAIGASVLGTGLGVVGQLQQGAAASSAADYQAQVARNNAVAAEQEAKAVEQRGAIEAQQRDLATRQRIGRQRTSAAARGVVVDEGSALALVEDEAAVGRLDSLTIRNNAAREALRLRTQGENFLSEADLLESTSDSARTAGFIGAGSTLLSGAGNVASKWKEFN